MSTEISSQIQEQHNETKKVEKTYTDEVYRLIEENRDEECIKYINENKLKAIDCVDNYGMTPLQYGAFRGKYEICELLIKKGANVNADTHDQGYSALMFAAISNHQNIVRLLLNNGADVDKKNSIGRNASQMAAFVNATECVDIINNFIPKSELEYYTKVNSSNDTEPKLPFSCVDDLHKILITPNYSPIFIIKMISQRADNLLPNIDKIINTLDAYLRKTFKQEDMGCPNDVLSFKLHYCGFIFDYIKKQIEKSTQNQEKEKPTNTKLVETIIKPFLSLETSTENNQLFRAHEERFIRESIRQFPYRECALLRQMVQILAKVKIGSTPTALYVITSCLNGQRFNNPDEDSDEKGENKQKNVHQCVTCSQKGAKLCSKCKRAAYCDQVCQRLHWFLHKKECN